MDRLALAQISLEGLTVGDAFGQKFFGAPERVQQEIQQRKLPPAPWFLTDDSIMALGIFDILKEYGRINQDALAQKFAQNYRISPARGYGGMAHNILQEIGNGEDWRKVSSRVFDGSGSYGNGAAMRVAPLGAFFSADGYEKVAEQAALSAEVTHFHPEGQAGGIAAAIAAAYICRNKENLSGEEMMKTVIEYTPDSDTRSKIQKALALPLEYKTETAVSALGNGSLVSAQDTVPFCLWCTARHIDNFEEALWTTLSGLGDRDTTCAIVGGILSPAKGIESIPAEWLKRREALIGWEKNK